MVLVQEQHNNKGTDWVNLHLFHACVELELCLNTLCAEHSMNTVHSMHAQQAEACVAICTLS